MTSIQTHGRNGEFAQGLQRLRKMAAERGVVQGKLRLRGTFQTRATDHQQSMRIGGRVYLLDSCYASSALHIRLGVRRPGQPTQDVLGEWRPQIVVDKTIDLIWRQIVEYVLANEARVRGEQR